MLYLGAILHQLFKVGSIKSLDFVERYLPVVQIRVRSPWHDQKLLVVAFEHLEHWNNMRDKQYGRNLGKKEGIEPVAI